MYRPAIGDSVDALDTPSMIVDISAMEDNIARLMARLKNTGKLIRPHLKTVKSPDLAMMLLQAGATGCCVAKVSEAEVMAHSGITDLLITSEVVGEAKISRLLDLISLYPDIKVVVDSQSGASQLDFAVLSRKLPAVKVLIEINVGQNRCGVAPGAEAVELATAVSRMSGLELVGVQGYEGHLQHLPYDRRVELCRQSMQLLSQTVEDIRSAGIPLAIVTTGGTGTCEICAECDLVTEVQPGSFVFMDVAYRNAIGSLYSNALAVLSTVISKPTKDRAVIDAGLKSLSNDMGNAEVRGCPGISYRPGGDEHGILDCAEGGDWLTVGTRVEMLPSHIDTTVNLYDCYYGIRNGVVSAIWPILARGKVQ